MVYRRIAAYVQKLIDSNRRQFSTPELTEEDIRIKVACRFAEEAFKQYKKDSGASTLHIHGVQAMLNYEIFCPENFTAEQQAQFIGALKWDLERCGPTVESIDLSTKDLYEGGEVNSLILFADIHLRTYHR